MQGYKMSSKPKKCLSLNCKDLGEIKKEIKEYLNYCDMVELCLDKMNGIETSTYREFSRFLSEMRFLTFGKKLIVKYRGEDEVTNRILRWSMGIVNYIDIEYNNPKRDELILEAKFRMTKVILSHHDYEKMMERDEIAHLFLLMERTKADILKICCMANNEKDKYEIMNGALKYSSLKGSKDIIAIAMGEFGKETRVCMGDFGGKITYAYGKSSTAPGQFDIVTLSKYLEDYYGQNN